MGPRMSYKNGGRSKTYEKKLKKNVFIYLGGKKEKGGIMETFQFVKRFI